MKKKKKSLLEIVEELNLRGGVISLDDQRYTAKYSFSEVNQSRYECVDCYCIDCPSDCHCMDCQDCED
jgi:hypothetical protein